MFHVKQSDISNNKMFHVKHFERNHSRGKTSAFVLGRHRGSDNGVARRHGGRGVEKFERRAVRTRFGGLQNCEVQEESSADGVCNGEKNIPK